MFPRLYVDLFEAARAGDIAKARELYALVMRVGELYCVGRHSSAIIKGIKCALSVLGLCDDCMAEPFTHFREPERAKVQALLAALHDEEKL